MVGDLRRMHHKEDPVAAGKFPQIEPQRLQQLGAGAFHEGEIVGMEHHAAGIGVLVVDPDRERQLSDRRSRAAAGAVMPKWR